MTARWLGVAACSVAAALGGLHACAKAKCGPAPPGPSPAALSGRRRAASFESLGSVVLERQHGPHPRILLTADRLAAVRGLRAAGAPSWKSLQSRCDEDVHETIGSGYEAWDWVNATLDLALCHAVAGRPEYAQAALGYFRALLDDQYKVGDGAGGDAMSSTTTMATRSARAAASARSRSTGCTTCPG